MHQTRAAARTVEAEQICPRASHRESYAQTNDIYPAEDTQEVLEASAENKLQNKTKPKKVLSTINAN